MLWVKYVSWYHDLFTNNGSLENIDYKTGSHLNYYYYFKVISAVKIEYQQVVFRRVLITNLMYFPGTEGCTIMYNGSIIPSNYSYKYMLLKAGKRPLGRSLDSSLYLERKLDSHLHNT